MRYFAVQAKRKNAVLDKKWKELELLLASEHKELLTCIERALKAVAESVQVNEEDISEVVGKARLSKESNDEIHKYEVDLEKSVQSDRKEVPTKEEAIAFLREQISILPTLKMSSKTKGVSTLDLRLAAACDIASAKSGLLVCDLYMHQEELFANGDVYILVTKLQEAVRQVEQDIHDEEEDD